VDNIAVGLEHVDLLDGLDRLHVQLLEGALELLVVGAGALVDLLDLSSRSTLAAESFISSCFPRSRFVPASPPPNVGASS